jgi:hypothetical protein
VSLNLLLIILILPFSATRFLAGVAVERGFSAGGRRGLARPGQGRSALGARRRGVGAGRGAGWMAGVQGVWVAVDGTGLLGCSRPRYRERRERGKRVRPGGWRRLQGEEQQGRATRVWVAGPLVGLKVREFFFEMHFK